MWKKVGNFYSNLNFFKGWKLLRLSQRSIKKPVEELNFVVLEQHARRLAMFIHSFYSQSLLNSLTQKL